MAQTAANIVQIGLRLQVVRQQIGREHFQEWLRDEFQWSQSVASNYMQAAAVFSRIDCLDHFQPSALYVLARKKASGHARQEALNRAQNGELITKTSAEAIVLKHSQPRTRSTVPTVQRMRQFVARMINDLEENDAEGLIDELPRLAQKLREAKQNALPAGTANISCPAKPQRRMRRPRKEQLGE